jgi:glutaredoxin-like protein NrdH
VARKVKLYAISTCGWCKKTKRFLEENNIEYEFEDVDLLEGAEKERARQEVASHNPRKSYPTIVIDDQVVVVGFDVDRLKEALGL